MIRFIIWCKPFAKYLLVALIITIITVSSIPSIPTLKLHTTKIDIRLDYLIHICEYGALSVMAFLTFAGDDFKMTLKRTSIISLSLILFAIIDELHQKFIPGRTYNINDIISNILGIFAALVFCIVLFRKIVQNHKKTE
jgi:VanZ family protein